MRGRRVWPVLLVQLIEGVVVNVAQVRNALTAAHDGTVANLNKNDFVNILVLHVMGTQDLQ